MTGALSSFYMPRINIVGVNASEKVSDEVIKLKGTKALIVTDSELLKTGIPDKVLKYLKNSNIEAVIWPGCNPNPTDENVNDGFDFYQKNNCNIIIAVGGGSPIDCAKGIRIIIDNGGTISDYEGLNKIKNLSTSLIAVNTTAGTASEITRFCIITDTKRKIKMAIVDCQCTPDVSINDPVLTAKMPPALTAATGMDALTHSVEAYVSTASTPITDALALKSIELISKFLKTAVENGENMFAREQMVYAELSAGMAFNNASLGYVHAMAHQLGGYYNLPHGVCNAILLPHVCRFNLEEVPKKFKDIAKAFGEDTTSLSDIEAGDKAINKIKELNKLVGIPLGLREFNINVDDLNVMAKNALVDACSLTNPRAGNVDDVISIFKSAM